MYPFPQPIKALVHGFSGGGVGLWTGVHPLHPPYLAAGIQNKANFPFQQHCPFIDFLNDKQPDPAFGYSPDPWLWLMRGRGDS